MASYLILGAGKFGRLALGRLTPQDDAASFVVVDCVPQALAAARASAPSRVQWVEAEAVTFLTENLKGAAFWDWLIPMVPFHVAFNWLWQGPMAKSGGEIIEVPEAVGRGVPLARRGDQGELYLSRATHLCPDDCPEAEPVCPVSGESRKIPLYEELASLKVPGFQVRVIPSRQLAPGVGGYPPGRLLALEQELLTFRGKVLIATACRCHGVVHAFKRGPGVTP
ncbi:MAG: hypothetical protein Q8M54_03405 [Desulfobaccales bacterium]|nr:hypothetical protein [Desulfobaccales bacterium]